MRPEKTNEDWKRRARLSAGLRTASGPAPTVAGFRRRHGDQLLDGLVNNGFVLKAKDNTLSISASGRRYLTDLSEITL